MIDENYKVSGALLQAVVSYLSERPYKEVAQLIDMIQRVEKITKDDSA